MDNVIRDFPRQAIPLRKKNKKWREDCVKAGDRSSVLSSSLIRKTVIHKKLNYDLFDGKLNMKDVESIINPFGIDDGMPTAKIQHYPVMNDKLMLLLGEERASQFDFRVTITNPNALSELEERKKQEVQSSMQKLIEDESLSEEEYNKRMQELADFFTYEYQDIREIRANCLLNHYKKEQNFDGTFNDGFADVLANNEEIYQCTIEGGEPIMRKINPIKLQVWGAGSSNRIEDADLITLEDYWSLGRILDVYRDKLSQEEVKRLEDLEYFKSDDRFGDRGDPRYYFMYGPYADRFDTDADGDISFADGVKMSHLPYDMQGNIRVLQVYWKSLRKIQEITRINPESGETEVEFKTETYIPDEDRGETSKAYYINEAWHGTMIGTGDKAIFVDCGPCQVQYNSMSNPSKCHFGFIGTIYNINEGTPYSLVDMMKPLQYMYDVTKDRLNKMLARNIGKVIQLNFAMKPAEWKTEKWLYYIKSQGIAVVDPTKEGSQGVKAGAFNVPPVIDAELGQSIQSMITFLEYLKAEMAEITGITKQRMGQIANRETVGGVERATLQSSHSTRWYFAKHDDTKKRVLECFLETAKIAMKGKTKKFQYILPDHSQRLIEIDGDMFAECDYGLVVDNGYDMQSLNQEIQQIAQAAMQNQMLMFSTYLKIRSNCSMAEKVKMIENDEKRMQQQQAEAQQQQAQLQQQQVQAEMQEKQAEMQLKDTMNQRDNDTKILLAQLQAKAQELANEDTDGDGIVEPNLEGDKLREQIREFDERLSFDKQKHKEDNDLKLTIAKIKPKTTSNKK